MKGEGACLVVREIGDGDFNGKIASIKGVDMESAILSIIHFKIESLDYLENEGRGFHELQFVVDVGMVVEHTQVDSTAELG